MQVGNVGLQKQITNNGIINKNNSTNFTGAASFISKTNSALKGSYKADGLLGTLGNINKFIMNKIETGGFFLEFVLLDFTSLVLPRVIQGFNRNKEELGHLNYQAGMEELLREAITGPSMFLIPLGCVTLAGKTMGEAAKINTPILRKFSKIFSNHQAGSLAKDSLEANKTKFAENLFDNIVSSKLTKQLADNDKNLLQSHKTRFVELLTQPTTDKAAYKESSKKFRELFAEINTRWFNAADTTAIATHTHKGKAVSTGVSDLFDYSKRFIGDVVSNSKKHVDDFAKAGKNITDDAVKSVIKQVTDMKVFGRRFLCIGGTLALAAFLSIIPKIYQLSAKNPGIDGISPDSKEVKK